MKRGSDSLESTTKTMSQTVALFWTLFLSIGLSIFLAWIIPNRTVDGFKNWDFGIWIYSFIIAFAIDTAMKRKSQLKENIELELNLLRHLYSLIEQLGSLAWQARIKKLINEYHQKIALSFSAHLESTTSFRAVIQSIYGYRAKDDHETTILTEALETIRELSEIRERVHYEFESHISWSQWLRLILSCGGLLAIMLLPKDTFLEQRFSIAVTIFVVLLPLDLLFHSNILSAERMRYFEGRYRRNISKIREKH